MKRFLIAVLFVLLADGISLAAIIVHWRGDENPLIFIHVQPELSKYLSIDIDGNEAIDFSLGADYGFLGIRAEGANQVIIWPSPPPNQGGAVEPLGEGYEIGEDLTYGLGWHQTARNGFTAIGIWMVNGLGPVTEGPFIGQRAYMGISFYIDEGLHYGWIDMKVADGGAGCWIYGWGYESDSDTPILAGAGRPGVVPEPSTLALLSLGAAALAWRRKHALRPNLAENSSKTG